MDESGPLSWNKRFCLGLINTSCFPLNIHSLRGLFGTISHFWWNPNCYLSFNWWFFPCSFPQVLHSKLPVKSECCRDDEKTVASAEAKTKAPTRLGQTDGGWKVETGHGNGSKCQNPWLQNRCWNFLTKHRDLTQQGVNQQKFADLTNRWYTGRSVVTNGKTSARQERVKVEEQQYLQMQVPWDGRMHWFVGLLTLNLEEIIDLKKISEIFQRLRNEFVARTTGGREQELCKVRRAGFHCQVWVGSGCLVWHIRGRNAPLEATSCDYGSDGGGGLYSNYSMCQQYTTWILPKMGIPPNHPFSQHFTIISYIPL